MSDMTSVSVVIPLHNGARYIGDTLTSLQAQSSRELEVIVVDDGSTDDGGDLASAHPVGPQVIRQKQLGVAVARNRGAIAAQGTWLAFLDQDDLWHAERLERIRPVLASERDGLVLTTLRSFGVHSDRELLRTSGRLIEGMVDVWVDDGSELAALCGDRPAIDLTGSDVRTWFTADDLLRRTITTTTTFFVHREHLRLIGGWSLHAKSIDDWWLLASSAQVRPIIEVDQPTHLYRIHGAATSRATKFWFPFATSVLARRFGAQVIELHEALTSAAENVALEHLLAQTLESVDYRSDPAVRAFTRHIAALLWPDGSASAKIRHGEWRRRLPEVAYRAARAARGSIIRPQVVRARFPLRVPGSDSR